MNKKIIRAVLKIPLTPFVLFFNSGMLTVGVFFTFWEWLYEASEFDKSITKQIQKEHLDELKKWFTTI